MKTYYTIILFLNATAVTLSVVFFFSEVDRHASAVLLTGTILLTLLLTGLLVYWLIRYFSIPPRRRIK